jgi:type II secretion system protein N
MAMPVLLPNLGPRARKIVRYAGFAVVGLIAFVFALQATFPFERVRDKIVEALAEKYDVTIGAVERGWIPGRVYFKAVSVRGRPVKVGDVPGALNIQELEVDVGLFSLLHGTASVKTDAQIGSGHIKAAVAASTSGTEVEVTGEDVPSASLPMRDFIGLPMSGKLRFAFDLDLPNVKNKAGKVAPDWTKADGNIEFACPTGCTVGDGKTKLKFALKNRSQQAFAEDGIDFGKLTVDKLDAAATLKQGKVEVTKLETKSDDGEVKLDLTIALNADLNQSQVTGCLRFRGSDGLIKREPKTHAALSTTGAPLGPDNLFHMKLDGQLREVRRIGQICSPTVAGKNMDNPGGTPTRPVPSSTTEPTQLPGGATPPAVPPGRTPGIASPASGAIPIAPSVTPPVTPPTPGSATPSVPPEGTGSAPGSAVPGAQGAQGEMPPVGAPPNGQLPPGPLPPGAAGLNGAAGAPPGQMQQPGGSEPVPPNPAGR